MEDYIFKNPEPLIMTFQNILADLKNRKFSPIYLLHGEESYYIDEISDYIEKNVLSEAEKGFNQTILYGKDTDFITIVNNAKRYPMMAEYQVLLIKEAQSLDWNKGSVDLLQSYLEQPLKSTILVFCYKYAKFDKRKKVYKSMDSKGIVLESNKIYDNKVAEWIAEYSRNAGYKIQHSAASLMAEYLGTDLSKIVNELDKMFLNVPKEREINNLDVQNNIGISKDFNVFELNKALAYKDVLKANQIVDYFTANPKSNPAPVVLGALGTYFTKVLKFHYAEDKSKAGLSKLIGVHSFFVDEYLVAGRNYSKRKTFNIVSLLREYDLKSKGVDTANNEIGPLLKELVYKILH